MSLTFWKEVGKINALRSQVGYLAGNGSDNVITCSTEPSQIRLFSTENAHGLLLTDTTDYSYADGDVTLVETPASGEFVVAISDGTYIFEDQSAQGNSADAADRTLEQQIFISVDDINATDIVVSINDYLSGDGLATSSHYLAPDDSGAAGVYGSAGASLDVGDKADGTITPIWVKAIIPEGTTMDNYHDIYLQADYNAFSAHL
jgi:hypothetical protein